MKKALFFTMISLLFTSCESEEDKASRFLIDKYTRKLNSIVLELVNSRTEEGTQNLLTLNSFYGRHTSKFENYINDIEFETISEKYLTKRKDLVQLARNYYEYLNHRKGAIAYLQKTSSDFQAIARLTDNYTEYKSKAVNSEYLSDYYWEMAISSAEEKREKSYEFLISKIMFVGEIEKMDSIVHNIDSVSRQCNTTLTELNLMDSIFVPENLLDSLNDWLRKSKPDIEGLKLE